MQDQAAFYLLLRKQVIPALHVSNLSQEASDFRIPLGDSYNTFDSYVRKNFFFACENAKEGAVN